MAETPEALIPYLCVRNASEAIAFYVAALGAREDFRLTDPGDGRIGHAELTIGNARFMLSDEYPDFGAVSPPSLGGSPVKFHIYVSDVDTAFARAIEAGGVEVRPVSNQFFGDRMGEFADPFGHTWTLATRIEDVTAEEMQQRWQAASE